ncbi:MAG: hypothetical protein AB7P42_16725, partial [Gammaproteobacteria bacterium]
MSTFTPAPFRRRPLTRLIAIVCASFSVTPAGAAPVNWLPDADGFWDVVANWSSNPALPGTVDDVTLDVGGTTVRTVTHRSGTTTINSLTSQENISLTGGTLSIAAASSLAGLFSQSGGLLSGTGTLTVSGAASLGGGAMSGAGTTVLQGTSTLNAGAGTFILDAGRILRNEGTLTWSGGTLALNSTFGPGAGDIENAAGAVFEATGNNILQASNVGGGDIGTDASFSNAGTFRKTTGTGTTTIGVAF